MTDTLILGGVAFDGYSTPAEIMAGGRQHMVVHKLPGGARVIDTLGPDEANVAWSGFFYGANALSNAQTLDAMRAAGTVVSLSYGGMSRSVIIESFVYKIRRFPFWVNYEVNCMVYQNPGLGVLGGVISTIDTLVLSDLNIATAAVTSIAGVLPL